MCSTRERYAAFLRGTLSVVAAIEPVVLAHGVIEAGGRAHALEADLDALGDTRRPRQRDGWRPDSVAAAFGAAYVVEGSCLGGLVLARRVVADLGPGWTRYLELRGAHTMTVWKRFVAVLDAWGHSAGAAERAAAIAAARATFTAYHEAFVAHGLVRTAA